MPSGGKKDSSPVSPTKIPIDFDDVKKSSPAALTVSPEMLASIISSAVAAALAHVNGQPRVSGPEPRTLKEAIDEFIVSKAKLKKSDRYLRQLRVSLSSFAKGRARTLLSDLTRADAEDWIFAQDFQPVTMHSYFGDVKTLLNWCVRQNYLAENFALAVELPPDLSHDRTPEIHTPAQVRKIIETAFGIDPDAGRHWAIRYFAGVRASELWKLREENIWLDRGYLEIPATVAKTRRRRLVKIEPNLRAWLELGGKLRKIDPDYVAKIRDFAQVPYKPNAPRKSFVTYHIAMWENAAQTALQAGHTEQMIFEHYKGLATKETAREFWSIAPPGKIVKVRGFKRKPHVR